MFDAGRLFWRWTGVITCVVWWTGLLAFMLLKGVQIQRRRELILTGYSVLNDVKEMEEGRVVQ